MDRAHEAAIVIRDSERCEPCFQFGRALVVEGDACDPAGVRNILDQRPRHRGRQSFGLAATRTGQQDAVPGLPCGGVLLRVSRQIGQGLGNGTVVRHGPRRT